MDARYTKLGFKKPDYVENRYGIKIYLGSTEKDDWCVEVPKELLKNNSKYPTWNKQNLTFFGVTEKFALELAEQYTNIAKNKRRMK